MEIKDKHQLGREVAAVYKMHFEEEPISKYNERDKKRPTRELGKKPKAYPASFIFPVVKGLLKTKGLIDDAYAIEEMKKVLSELAS